jgi:hypothetical protein
MKVQMTIPTGMEDVTINTYRTLQQAMDASTSEIDKVCAAVSVLCGVEKWVVMGMSAKDFEDIRKDLQWAMTPKEDWEFIPTTYLNGVEYGFIPDLTDLSVGEFADLDTLVQNGRTFDNLEKIMAILYRPITERWNDFYEIAPYDPKAKDIEIMKGMTMDVVMGAVVFFWHTAEALATSSPLYSTRARSRNRTLWRTSGVGTIRFMRWLKGST